MTVRIEESWRNELADVWEKDYFVRLTEFVREQYRTSRVFPPGRQIFAAFDATPFNEVKVVILGQDPYHDDGQANGLCFSVNDGVPLPPSLQNIFKEIHDDTGAPIPASGGRGDSPPCRPQGASGLHPVGQLCHAQGQHD